MKRIGLYPRVRLTRAAPGSCRRPEASCRSRLPVRPAWIGRCRRRWPMPMATATATATAMATAMHDPAKVITDLALTVALGGDCLADVALLRAEPAVFGRVASDPTMSRTIDALAADATRVLKAIDAARVTARSRVRSLAGVHARDHGIDADPPLVIDTDATLITAHSDKEQAAPTFKRGFGFHPLWAFVDHGAQGTGEPLSFLLRKGNAGSNTAAERSPWSRRLWRSCPGTSPERGLAARVLIRADGAGCTHDFLNDPWPPNLAALVEPMNWLVGQRLSYSVGFTLPDTFTAVLATMPKKGWAPAYTCDGDVREGAWVADVTGLLDLSSWPAGMRVIVRKERPHPGAQLRIADADEHRVTAFATNTSRGQLADLELRRRRRAHCEDRIRTAKDTGLTNLPLHNFTQNQVWCAIVALAVGLPAWMQMLTLAGHDARRWDRTACGYGCSASPPASPSTAAPADCTCPDTPRGRGCSRT